MSEDLPVQHVRAEDCDSKTLTEMLQHIIGALVMRLPNEETSITESELVRYRDTRKGVRVQLVPDAADPQFIERIDIKVVPHE